MAGPWSSPRASASKSEDTNLSDVFFSMQTELPVKKQTLASVTYASKGGWLANANEDIRRLLETHVLREIETLMKVQPPVAET